MNDDLSKDKSVVPLERIERSVLLIRGQKAMLSVQLAELYGVETRALNQAAKRNISRFPEDFMFQLNSAEVEQMVSQNVIPHKKYFGGSLPYAFTPLESPAIYSGDEIYRGSILTERVSENPILSNGVNRAGRSNALQCFKQ